ncbi:MAG TPA: histidinol dehydrogenase [Bacillota bacterium]|nr:histidinol dehydrogenase [Bacillota bacterium]
MRILHTNNEIKLVRQLLNRRPEFQGESQAQLTAAVAEILSLVRNSGDQALIDLTAKFDGVVLNVTDLRVTPAEFDVAYQQVPAEFLQALRQAKENIIAFHTKQLPKDWLDVKDDGVILGQRYQAVASAGLYVPGGIAGSTPLVSSVLMNALPARVAGVGRVVVCTPPNRSGGVNPYLLVAAAECGISEVYKTGGAQAIAAMAFGTNTIQPVDVIVGPGNRYVTEAKRQVFGYVGLDMLAGPSELLVIADADNNPAFIAADLLSQAEHGPVNEAGAFLLTPSAQLADAVEAEVERQISQLSRNQIATDSLEVSGAIVITADMDEAFELANCAAPEHLELMVADPWSQLHRIKNAGAVFLGPYSTEPIGDYVAGTNHVLPTNGNSRFASGLNVDHFIKKTSIIYYNEAGIRRFGPAAVEIAGVEGLDGHANAVKIRTE